MTLISTSGDGPATEPGLPGVHLSAAATAVRAWLASGGPRSLAVTGPVGIGKSRVLAALSAELADRADVDVIEASIVTPEAARHLAHRVAHHVARAERTGAPTLLLVLDDFERLAAASQELLLELPHRFDPVRLIVTATVPGQFDGVIELPVPTLGGSVDTSVADLDDFRSSELVRAFLEFLRLRNPAFELDRTDHAAVAQICASSLGVPAELELLAELVDRFGIASVNDAVAELGPRHHLAELVGELGVTDADLSADEIVVLASIFASPGGASVEMLRQSLPRCDIDASAQALITRGFVLGSCDPHEDVQRGQSSRYHLRISAVPVASWCACQSEVPFAAIRHAQADYLHARIVKMTEQLYADSQQAVFAEFQHELPNLRGTIAELIGIGKFPLAIALMSDALPLLARTCGVAELLPDMLRVLRAFEPATEDDSRRLALLAIRVFAAAEEQEAASVLLDQLVTEHAAVKTDPDIALLRVLVCDQPDDEATTTLADCVATYRQNRDMARLSEASAEYFALLMRAHRFEQAEADCRFVLAEATRNGDAYAAGTVLLWRAVTACAAGTGDARRYVERALAKLRPIGPAAALSAIRVVLDNRHLHNLGQSGIDLAMVTGALSRSDFAPSATTPNAPPVLPDAEQRLAERIGSRAVQRWSSAGACADLAEMLCEMLKRRYVDGLPGSIELRTCGVTNGDQVDPTALGTQSTLTAREAEVASLVATGLTNKQVAFRLHISEWTVINHLRQVMRKLDCSSRVQVARWVSNVAGRADGAAIAAG
ncbi:MAG TPA: LuxR C-terminal-related transcriptional regulator [Jatrophihabitans sp.]|nr:LuxR C-terminal-related transcriptional regulator [Jatrophihabitans sp.]